VELRKLAGDPTQSRRMTFRKLPEKEKKVAVCQKAIALMLAQPSMIKRPVLDLGGGKLVVGFKPEIYEAAVPT